jgi:uncharacterized metal-binding protein YceD (DUF177 family)
MPTHWRCRLQIIKKADNVFVAEPFFVHLRSFCDPLIEIAVDWRRHFFVQFEGLKEGLHHFDFEVSDAFFSEFEGSLIDQANVKVAVALDKKSNMMLLDMHFAGEVSTECDLCGDPLAVELDFDRSVIVKFGDNPDDSTDELVFIPHTAYELDMAPLIYEYLVLAMPLRNVHPKGKCNAEALNLLATLTVRKDDDIDPRWSELNKLKNE